MTRAQASVATRRQMGSEPIEVPIARLVEDLAVYPRHAVDESHVSSLALALRAGATLPPITVEQLADGTPGRIVDGWHRVRALKRVLGADGTVAAVLRTYATEADLLIDAVALNAHHGRRMDRIDQIRAVLLLEQQGVPATRIAVALEVPPERVLKLRLRTAQLPEGMEIDTAVPGTQQITLKRSVRHLDGRVLTVHQARAHASAPGVSYLLVSRQLREGMASGLLDASDERLLEELRGLAGVLAAFLKAQLA